MFESIKKFFRKEEAETSEPQKTSKPLLKSNKKIEMTSKQIKQVEDKIRDLINTISVMSNEEVEGATKKVEDEAAEELKTKLREIAKLAGSTRF